MEIQNIGDINITEISGKNALRFMNIMYAWPPQVTYIQCYAHILTTVLAICFEAGILLEGLEVYKIRIH